MYGRYMHTDIHKFAFAHVIFKCSHSFNQTVGFYVLLIILTILHKCKNVVFTGAKRKLTEKEKEKSTYIISTSAAHGKWKETVKWNKCFVLVVPMPLSLSIFLSFFFPESLIYSESEWTLKKNKNYTITTTVIITLCILRLRVLLPWRWFEGFTKFSHLLANAWYIFSSHYIASNSLL